MAVFNALLFITTCHNTWSRPQQNLTQVIQKPIYVKNSSKMVYHYVQASWKKPNEIIIYLAIPRSKTFF